VNPDHAVFGFQLITCDVEDLVFVVTEFLGDEIDGEDVADGWYEDQAAFASSTGPGFQFQGARSSRRLIL